MHGCECTEDETHVFFTCPFAKALWFAAPGRIRWSEQTTNDNNIYLEQIWNPEFLRPMARRDRENFILYSATIIDHIWWVWNELCHQDYQTSLEGPVQTISSRFEELKNAINQVASMQGENQPGLAFNGWRQPPRGAIKINSDAAVRRNHSFFGVVARKEDGDIVEAHSFKASTNNPLAAKLMAIKKAILVSIDNGWHDIVCESDAQIIIDCLNGENHKHLHWKMKPIVKVILSLCSMFCSVRFV